MMPQASQPFMKRESPLRITTRAAARVVIRKKLYLTEVSFITDHRLNKVKTIIPRHHSLS